MKGDKTFFKILISYVSIILLTVVLIGALTVSTLFTRLESDTEKLNQNIIEQTEQVLDAELRAVLSLPHQFLTNDEFNNILSMQYSNQSDKIYKSWKAIKQLYSYQTGYTSVRNVAVYSKKNECVLDSSSIYSEKEYFEKIFKNSTLTYDDWRKCLDSSNLTHFFISTQINSEDVQKEVLIYCQGLRRENPENGGLFIAIIDKAEMLEKLRIDNLSRTIAFAAVDRKGKTVLKTENFDINIDASLLKEKSGELKQGKYKVIYNTSGVLEVKYVYLFPKNAFLGSVGYLLPTFLLILLLAIAVSVIAANFSAKNMQKSILEILDENKLLSEELDEHVATSREKLFLNLLYNVPLKQKEIRAVDKLNIKNKLFRVFVVKGEERDNFEVYNDRIAIAWTEVNNVLADMLQALPIDVYSLRTSETSYVYILNYNDADSIINGINSVVERFVEKYGISITAAVGEEVGDIYSINSSYEEAMYASRYNNAQKSNEVVFCDDIERSENKKLYYTVEKEQLLIRNIKTGKTQELMGLFDEIYNVNFLQRRLTQEMLKRLVLHILLMLFKILDETYAPEDKTNEHYVRVCQNILRNDDPEEAFITLREICISISEKLPEQKGEMQLKNKIESYITQNYSNMDLSLNMLAEHIGMSYNYLSKMFKESFGTNFVNYVTAIRLEEAKKLLKATDLSVEQIAQQVGFGRSNSFIKIFKKYYNITPGQFRNRNI